jgi:hypothetical protein
MQVALEHFQHVVSSGEAVQASRETTIWVAEEETLDAVSRRVSNKDIPFCCWNNQMSHDHSQAADENSRGYLAPFLDHKTAVENDIEDHKGE